MTIGQESGEPTGLTVLRRLGTAPTERAECSYGGDCPDVFELSNGDFAVIGHDVSLSLELPSDAGRSQDERTVVVPRDVLLAALRQLSSGI